MVRPPLHVPVRIDYGGQQFPAYVSRHFQEGYVVTLTATGVELFSSSFELIGVKVHFLHPNVGAAARIRLPLRENWISCVVKELCDPAPAVQLEACNTGCVPPPLLETNTFMHLKITLEYVESVPRKDDIPAPQNAQPPIGADIEVRISGAWRTGAVVEHQGDSHYIVEVPEVGRFFSQSFQLLHLETRPKRPPLGVSAVVHLKSGGIPCAVVGHSKLSQVFILAACSDLEIQFDSRALAFFGIQMVLNRTRAKRKVLDKSAKKEDELDDQQHDPISPPTCSPMQSPLLQSSNENIRNGRKSKKECPRKRSRSIHWELSEIDDSTNDEAVHPRHSRSKNMWNQFTEAELENNPNPPPPSSTKKCVVSRRLPPVYVSDDDLFDDDTVNDERLLNDDVVLSRNGGNIGDSMGGQAANLEYSGRKISPPSNGAIALTMNRSASPGLVKNMGSSANDRSKRREDEVEMVDDDDVVDSTGNNKESLDEAVKLPKAKAVAVLVDDDIEENVKFTEIRKQLVESFRRVACNKKPEVEMKKALSLGRSLVQEYNVDESERESGNFKVIILKNDKTFKKRFPLADWMHKLACAISVNYNVKNLYTKDRRKPTEFTFLGLQSSAELAALSFYAAFDQIHRLALKCKRNPSRRGHQSLTQLQNSFAFGMAASLEKTAKLETKNEREAKSPALAKRAKKAKEIELRASLLYDFVDG